MAEALRVDPARLDYVGTGVYVRAKHEDRWGSFDIAQLDRASLRIWLRSRGGENVWAESLVILLGHGPEET